ncbi:D-alanyl-D-alanine carboxypeptidase / D-alanyl-D-alanine-endopeptidase (penicillin-binding protein 4) [Sanguibacter gelidistatuariae]|uniref:D-alanyl-D-alanine carboxypeptidase / D-alanyl-D-alanine-endopeptidase (Penicillin-binding protein 4) n=1 Tax=Sanguibacter gelidistatuariae TaxID=1814289 RepID=A0A1G6HSL4_9MICO|nr:D-alanyl-D-alanine carboxypeptidase/D-alanyl-D-alanine-endopeptidase [Sanguibacter gelidistatuariae]SDB97174.1 D-alanyl-D-alanine carboxypeptidase / D-alanyl-D-alanine-endopeptidase (penicillin-binding protein 4) [Sanguibacter gelidistatuariae]
MALMARVVAGTIAAGLVVAGGYAWADAHDVVPGILTLGPEPAAAAPFPTAPAAIPGPALQDTLQVLDAAAPVPDAATVQAAVDALVADPAMGASTGVVVSDALTGDVLASASPEVARVPASIQKLLTATAALSAVGYDRVLTTTVTQSASGAITLVGGGDMMLSAGAGDPAAVTGHAGLDDLATQVAKELALAGTTTVKLALDDTLFTGSPTGLWAEEIPSLGYAAPVSAIAVDTGRLSAGEYAPRQGDPALSAANAFVTALAAHGVTVDGAPSRGTSVKAARVIASVDSAPMGEIVQYFLHTSDNTITEVVGRIVALDAGLPGSFEGATKAVLTELTDLGIDTSGAVMADCSGLADGSRISATTMLEVLDLLADPAHPRLRPVIIGMPIAGLDGTLNDRFLTSEARGLVRAKTGSLPHVTSLAGTALSADGRQLTFVIMADQTPDGGQWGPRRAIDAFVSDLAACGCR